MSYIQTISDTTKLIAKKLLRKKLSWVDSRKYHVWACLAENGYKRLHTLQMKSMAIKKINWDLYLLYLKKLFKSPYPGLSCLSLFWALLSTAQIVHHIFCEHLENWNVHFLHNSSLLLSIFRLVWVFLWSKFTCQFRKCVLSMCAKQAEKNDTAKTAQHSRVVQ